jgi:hypothetical protein
LHLKPERKGNGENEEEKGIQVQGLQGELRFPERCLEAPRRKS